MNVSHRWGAVAILALAAFAGLVLTTAEPQLRAGGLPTDDVGLVDSDQGKWHLRDAAGDVTSFFYGNPMDIPFVGDWDCDGVDTPGLFRQSDAFAYLRNSNTQGIANIRFFFGDPDDVPLAGDFDGDGCDTLSIYRPGEQRFYVINRLGENEGGLGGADFFFTFGNPGDKPVVGDWDGDGIDEVGLHRESTGFFYWRNSLTSGVADGEIFFGDPGDRFAAGDWGAVDGKDTPAAFRPSDMTFYFRHTLTQGLADSQFAFGQEGWMPVAGVFESDTTAPTPTSSTTSSTTPSTSTPSTTSSTTSSTTTSSTTTTVSGSQDGDGDGFSPNEGDCDDADPAVHPNAVDLPDAAFQDTNCDGIDGEAANAAFVSTTGSDDGGCGTRAIPCASVQKGIDQATTAALRDVYVQAGIYTDASFTLGDGINIFGGFGANFQRSPGNETEVRGQADFEVAPGNTQAVTVLASGLTEPTVVADLKIVGPDTTDRLPNGQGKSSYAVVINDVAPGLLLFERNTVVGGLGADGRDGIDGPDAPVLDGAALQGDTGGDSSVVTTCDDSTKGLGGVAGTNPSVGAAAVGGDGGDGGPADTLVGPFPPLCEDGTAQAGQPGADAAAPIDMNGLGGAGGAGAATCGAGQPGTDGSITNGTGGRGGNGSVLVGGFWYGAAGTAGGRGQHGGGGGGGGGSGGCDTGTDAHGAGGGGGGAGGARARSGGAGGKGGGGSFGFFLTNASPTINGNTIEQGTAGAGGPGGTGGRGQSGGPGGSAGAGASGAQPGGAGGRGGHGGHGGGGGGGAGGASVGVYMTSGTSNPTMNNNTFNGGTPGSGGQGGESAPTAPAPERDGVPGQDGAPGTSTTSCTGC